MCRPWYRLAFPGEDTGLNPEPTRLGWERELALATNVGRLELEGDQMGSCVAKAAAGHQDRVNIPAIDYCVESCVDNTVSVCTARTH